MAWIGWVGIGILFVCVIFLIKASVRMKVADWVEAKWYRLWLVPAALLYFNALLMNFGKSWDTLVFFSLCLYFAGPMLILSIAGPRDPRQGPSRASGWVDMGLILLLWIPVELGIIQKSWKIGSSSYPLITASAMIFALIAYASYRKPSGLNGKSFFCLDWHFSKKDLLTAVAAFAALAAVLIPLALAIDFTNWPALNQKLPKKLPGYPWTLPAVFALIWFAPALVEEIIFRGVIQSALVEKLKPVVGIAVSSLIFGFAHINNATAYYCALEPGSEVRTKIKYDYPNWRYVILAAIAGVAYGLVYHFRKKAGSRNALGAAALVHCLVDFTWLLLFKDNY